MLPLQLKKHMLLSIQERQWFLSLAAENFQRKLEHLNCMCAQPSACVAEAVAIHAERK
jgi:hypothetical protein